jgi:hypothetical protein
MSKHRRPTHARRRTGLAAVALGVAALTTLGASAPALAAKGGAGGKGGGGGKPSHSAPATGTFQLVLSESTDGQAHWGQHITFDVTSNATYYFVGVACSQGGAVVYQQDIGFYPGWPWSQEFTLMSYAWTGGAADCSARLYSSLSDGSNQQTLATMTFPVAA